MGESMKQIAWNDGWQLRHLDSQDEWQSVTLPYDCMLHEKRSDEGPGGCNNGWFEAYDYELVKRFSCTAQQLRQHIFLELEAVYHLGEVYCNDQLVVSRPNGYLPLTGELTPYLREGENTVRVIAHNAQMPSARWYTGAGIYRPVWWYEAEKTHILLHSLRIRTLSTEPACIQVSGATSEKGSVQLDILDGENVIASAVCESDGHFTAQIRLENIKCWSLEAPKLYECRAHFGNDEARARFGVRIVTCSAATGLCINGRRVLLRGACIHHDNGLLGAAAFDEAEERKVLLLKSVGYNAIRSAHNPCSRALLEACDRYGMLVMDEYEDAWFVHKTRYDYAGHLKTWYQQDLADLAQKDYNHPSVILYSLGNEVSESALPEGVALFKQMKSCLRSQDDTRPITCGINIGFNQAMASGHSFFSDEKAAAFDIHDLGTEEKNHRKWLFGALTMKLNALMPGCDRATRDIFAASDVAGYNYGLYRYRMDRRKYPERVILGSESFCVDEERFLRAAKRDPGIIGDFVWTGIDHLGEVGLGAWEYREDAPTFLHSNGWLTSGVGSIDITGRLRPEAYYTRAAYGLLQKPYIAVVPPNHAGERHSPSGWKMTAAVASWGWQGCEGKRCIIEVYGCGDHVTLFLNGIRKGTKRLRRSCRARFRLPYEPGILTAVVYDRKENELGSTSLMSLDEQRKLTLEAEKQKLSPGELCYVRIRMTDGAGTTDVLSNEKIYLEAEGGELLGFGHACPFNRDGYTGNQTKVYHGEAMAILRAGQEGAICLRAYADGRKAELTIDIQ